jgi:hypothetical protein
MKSNWENLGLKSRNEGVAKILKALFENRKKIIAKSISGEAVFVLGNQMVVLDKKGFKV